MISKDESPTGEAILPTGGAMTTVAKTASELYWRQGSLLEQLNSTVYFAIRQYRGI